MLYIVTKMLVYINNYKKIFVTINRCVYANDFKCFSNSISNRSYIPVTMHASDVILLQVFQYFSKCFCNFNCCFVSFLSILILLLIPNKLHGPVLGFQWQMSGTEVLALFIWLKKIKRKSFPAVEGPHAQYFEKVKI